LEFFGFNIWHASTTRTEIRRLKVVESAHFAVVVVKGYAHENTIASGHECNEILEFFEVIPSSLLDDLWLPSGVLPHSLIKIMSAEAFA
jgi:hypothetical protein